MDWWKIEGYGVQVRRMRGWSFVGTRAVVGDFDESTFRLGGRGWMEVVRWKLSSIVDFGRRKGKELLLLLGFSFSLYVRKQKQVFPDARYEHIYKTKYEGLAIDLVLVLKQGRWEECRFPAWSWRLLRFWCACRAFAFAGNNNRDGRR